jgi:uncharacterized protein YbaR (Trm112 family)
MKIAHPFLKYQRKPMLDSALISLLACPNCKEKLFYSAAENQLICKGEDIVFPIKEHIPQLSYQKAVSSD